MQISSKDFLLLLKGSDGSYLVKGPPIAFFVALTSSYLPVETKSLTNIPPNDTLSLVALVEFSTKVGWGGVGVQRWVDFPLKKKEEKKRLYNT